MSDVEVTTVRPLNKLLRMAVTTGVESALRVHIERGDDLNARDQNGLTPLMLAAARNRPGICKLLLAAGADAELLDRSGRTALNIATSVSAHETVAVLESERSVFESPQDRAPELPHSSANIIQLAASQVVSLGSSVGDVSWNVGGVVPINIAAANLESGTSTRADEFDLSGWEAESDVTAPPEDTSIGVAASAIQASITEHDPVDSSSDWDDIDAYLPEQSTPLLRPDDTEARKRLRLLLLRAIREGSVPRQVVEDLSVNVDRSFSPEAEALLCMVINDLGADVDERFEYSGASESFEVQIVPDTTPDEEEALEEALAFLDGLTFRRADPHRFYQRDFQREKRLTADEEISLAQSMERALEAAIDALASWPGGIETTLAAGRQIESGQRSLNSVSLGPLEVSEELGTDLVQEDGHISAPESATERPEVNIALLQGVEASANDFASTFSQALKRLAALAVPTTQHGSQGHGARDTLKTLRLNQRFLLELADESKCNGSNPPADYVEAIAAYRCAWERMIVANLKLANHLAMKYRYSGEPLDDLIQEGNFGLFKAVERFDWRRGFKFSTYATWWIRQQLGRYVADKCRAIRLPVHVYEKVQRVCRVAERLESETGFAPRPEEVAARMDMPVHVVVSLLRHAGDILSVEELCIDDEIAVEARPDFMAPDPLEVALRTDLFRTVDSLLHTLKPKEQRVVRMRFGIGINDMLTLEEVGIRFDVTRERIRQIEATALRKLRHPSRLDALASYATSSPLKEHDKNEQEQFQDGEQENVADVKSTPRTSTGAVSSEPKPRLVRSGSLEMVLTQAAELGIPVEDDRLGPTGRIWVRFNATQDQGHRKLARKLMALGFEFWQGMGYWK
jgi:RNA polymerase primary sigma factor